MLSFDVSTIVPTLHPTTTTTMPRAEPEKVSTRQQPHEAATLGPPGLEGLGRAAVDDEKEEETKPNKNKNNQYDLVKTRKS